MTRKDFELIAATLKAEYSGDVTPDQITLLKLLAYQFAERLKATNSQFNRDKFLRACGVTP